MYIDYAINNATLWFIVTISLLYYCEKQTKIVINTDIGDLQAPYTSRLLGIQELSNKKISTVSS